MNEGCILDEGTKFVEGFWTKLFLEVAGKYLGFQNGVFFLLRLVRSEEMFIVWVAEELGCFLIHVLV